MPMLKLRASATSSLGLVKASGVADTDGSGYHYMLAPLHVKPSVSSNESVRQRDTLDCAVISSDDIVRVFKPADLAANTEPRVTTLGKHESVTCIAPWSGHVGEGWMTGGRDASVKHWDKRTRSDSRPVRECLNERKAPYLSIASDPNGYLWAAGTELTAHVAEVQIWDLRSPKDPMVVYQECHSDDVSILNFSSSPFDQGTLLSGSTDGLVNVFAANFPSDEDEAIVQTINHGSSIHRAGFLPCQPFFQKHIDSSIYALSHDETFAIYKRENTDSFVDTDEQMGDGDDDAAAIANQSQAWGDVRPLLNCEYVIDVLPNAKGAILAVGSHSETRVDLVQLRYKPADSIRKAWKLRQEPIFSLEGAHGEEIVRSLVVYEAGGSLQFITAGEDGLVKSWLPDSGSADQDVIMGEEASAVPPIKSRSGENSAQLNSNLKRKRDKES